MIPLVLLVNFVYGSMVLCECIVCLEERRQNNNKVIRTFLITNKVFFYFKLFFFQSENNKIYTKKNSECIYSNFNGRKVSCYPYIKDKLIFLHKLKQKIFNTTFKSID